MGLDPATSPLLCTHTTPATSSSSLRVPSSACMAQPYTDNTGWVQSVLPDTKLSLASPSFPLAEEWNQFSWSGSMVLSLKYIPREKKWAGSIALEPGSYSMDLHIQCDGSVPVLVDLVKTTGASLGLITLETLSPINQLLRLTTHEPTTISAKVPATTYTTVNIIAVLAKASRVGILGRSEPILVTDHKQVTTPRPLHKKDLTTEGVEPNPGPNMNAYLFLPLVCSLPGERQFGSFNSQPRRYNGQSVRPILYARARC